MLLIHTPEITPRVNYCFHLIFRDILQISFQLTTREDDFLKAKRPKFSYGSKAINDELFFRSADLLFQTGIIKQEVNSIRFNNMPALFPVEHDSVLPFDPFAACFYLVSRYEEYLPHEKDDHLRYESAQSIAFQQGFLHKPMVNIWAGFIRDTLLKRFPEIHFPVRRFRHIATIDIDNAWAYKGKGFIRNTGGIFSDLFKRDFKNLKRRIKVIAGIQKDPYDTYDHQEKIFGQYRITPIYFFLIGDYARYDKNVPHHNKAFQNLIRSLADRAEIGIHPSYGSGNSASKLSSEISRLSKIIERKIHLSRQHFLRLQIPETYRNLIRQGISDDYTMGYPDSIGFRAGICTSFYFFDLEREMETSLRVHPFCLMDGTLKDYMKLKPTETFSMIDELLAEVRNVSGDLISLWHNESFAENDRWKGWRKVYEYLLEKTSQNERTAA